MELHVKGHAAYAYTGGRPHQADQPCVVFLHGAGNDHSVWALQSRYLAHHGHAVLCPDLPGHGRSAGEPLTSVEALADWVVALLDAAGVARATLAGHSMGSLVALATAARAPQRVERLALIGTAVPMPVAENLLDAARHKTESAYRMINQWSHAPASLLGGHPVPGLWMPGMGLALMRRSRPGALATDLANCNAYQNGLQAAAQVTCPTLLVIGRRDLMTPPRATKGLREALANVRSIEIDGCGHAMMAERPEAVLGALRDFLHTP